jgi:hypothetical protein
LLRKKAGIITIAKNIFDYIVKARFQKAVEAQNYVFGSTIAVSVKYKKAVTIELKSNVVRAAEKSNSLEN